MVREGEVLSQLSATLEGTRIAIDAGHGPDDPGAVGPSGLTEHEAGLMLSEALAEELRARGAAPFLVRKASDTPSAAERAAAAKDGGAEVLISIHLNAHQDPKAEGALCFFYGREDYVSKGGQRLAELTLDELTGRMGLTDGRAHPKSLPLMRETDMPVVHVEPCFITNPREEALLRQERFRVGVARALASAIERYFATGLRESASALAAEDKEQGPQRSPESDRSNRS